MVGVACLHFCIATGRGLVPQIGWCVQCVGFSLDSFNCTHVAKQSSKVVTVAAVVPFECKLLSRLIVIIFTDWSVMGGGVAFARVERLVVCISIHEVCKSRKLPPWPRHR